MSKDELLENVPFDDRYKYEPFIDKLRKWVDGKKKKCKHHTEDEVLVSICDYCEYNYPYNQALDDIMEDLK